MPVLRLIRTSPEFPPGSMAVYAQMVLQAAPALVTGRLQIRTCDFFDPAGDASMRRHHLWRLRHARSFFSKHPAEFYHLLDGSMAGFIPRELWDKTIVTVHDLIPLLQIQGRLPGRTGLAGRWIVSRSMNALRHVAGITAVSEHTRRDLATETGRSDIVVIPNPVRTMNSQPVAAGADLPLRYIFHVGNNAAYKNRAGVLAVFEQLQDMKDLHLIMAGPAPTRDLERAAGRLARVRFEINPSDNRLSILYKKAAAFLFPSLYEGFGMPVLEAMAAGCPVVCSSAASLPEVAGDAALLALPENVSGLAAQCRRVIEDCSVRRMLVARGEQRLQWFTAAEFSRALAAFYAREISLLHSSAAKRSGTTSQDQL